MTAPHVDLRGSGVAWTAYVDGKPVKTWITSISTATSRLPGLERRLKPTLPRACMGCGRAFHSTGKGHRLCKTCKDAA